MKEWFTVENIELVAAQYRTLGPVIGLLLPFLEAFLPFLPLVVFVVANASAFGLWLGFLLSWLGSAAGSYVVFLLVRHFGKHPRLRFITGSKKVQKLIKWVDMNGISPLFVLLCFPFTPSVIVNIVAGLSHIHKKFYFVVLLAGKFVMILGMSVLGYDLKSLLTSPVKLIIAAVAIVILWFIGKLIEKRLNARVERDLKQARNLTKNQDHHAR
ncbi:TVP38/TMEM64 family protein [Lysinibacillus sp. FSL R7-0073]|uniref:TVP38/TMEM64 family protein n=1 Tax=Lysinibacillus TaxID=400634 RepID=UPI00215A8D34|nr:TVP38/TMEM64 family protein [Lysinibacillus fusiformis]MCR8851244.1 TVP38/TMEM64 family protein [Lysinibacillus fusiformis]WKT77774.1 TVP38/TMEM64 family protein [Lysinibacillus fusiformis]